MAVIREVGDRLNLIAYCYRRKVLETAFLESSGVTVDIGDFLKHIDEAQKSEKEQRTPLADSRAVIKSAAVIIRRNG